MFPTCLESGRTKEENSIELQLMITQKGRDTQKGPVKRGLDKYDI